MTGKANLEEKKSHGNIMFPFSVYHASFNSNENIMYHHWHNEVEFIYLKKGTAVFQLDSEEIKLDSGQAILVNSGVVHSGYSKLEGEYHPIVFDLNLLNSRAEDNCQLKFINPILHNHYRFTPYIAGNEEWDNQIIKLIIEIINLFFAKKPGFELAIKSALYQILYQLVSNDKLEKIQTEKVYKIERLKKVLKYIHQNYNQEINLKEMADVINISKYHFSRFFKSLTGKTPIDYLNSYRINQASHLLYDQNRQILDIALAVGFNNFSYFIKTFKKYKGCTPSDFRDSL